jgi:cytochrome c553
MLRVFRRPPPSAANVMKSPLSSICTRLLLAASLFGATAGLHAAAPKPTEVPDTMEQRLLACATCHGKQGQGSAKNATYPPLAGKAEGYLYNQLLNFRDGRRRYAVMNYMLGFLSDAYLREIAEHYSRLPPAHQPRPTGLSSSMLARGEALVTLGDPARKLPACNECHGKSLTGTPPFIPRLVGLSQDYIAQQMGAWQVHGRRAKEPDCMAQIAALLTADEISAVGGWLASLPAPSNAASPVHAAKLPMECGSLTQR